MKKIVLGVIAISILHSILFFAQDLGISVVLFTVAMMGLIIYSLIVKNKVKNSKAFLLSIPITLIGLTYGIFNNVFFNIMNFFVLIGLTSIMVIWAIYGEFNFGNIITKSFMLAFKPIICIPEAAKLLFSNKSTQKNNNDNSNKKEKIVESKIFKQIVLGLIISIPLLIVILSLLISADTIFAQILGPIKELILNIFKLKFWVSIYFRAIVAIIVAIYIMAFICNMLKTNTDEVKSVNNNGIKLQNITVNTVLTVLNIVYLLFCIVQFIHLFMQIGIGGEVDFANYARKGFFQLMIVTVINFIIVLITNANKKETTKFTENYTKVMNLFLIIFTIVMIISSYIRMYLYEQEFGYTFLRLMVFFTLVTELILSIPTVIYIFNKKFKLLKSYIVIFSIMYVVVNFANVDKTIAKRNVDKYIKDSKLNIELRKDAEVDFIYLKRLSIDSIPDIIRLYENTDDSYLKMQIKTYLNRVYDKKVLNKEKTNIQEINIQEEIGKKKLTEWINKENNKETVKLWNDGI